MIKILYIEDNKDTAEAVKIILNNAGYKTITGRVWKARPKINRTANFRFNPFRHHAS